MESPNLPDTLITNSINGFLGIQEDTHLLRLSNIYKKTNLLQRLYKDFKAKAETHYSSIDELRKEVKEIYQKLTILTKIINEEIDLRKAIEDKLVVEKAKEDDITETALALEKIKESEERYRTLVETMNDGVMTVDKNDIILFVNTKFCAVTGYTYKDLIGKKARKFLVDEKHQYLIDHILSQRENGITSQYELPLKTKSGKFIWMLISGSPLFDRDGNVIGSIGVHTDITVRKEAEEKLLKAKEITEETTRAKETFYANISHEIRTPMNGIVGLTDLLSKTKLSAKQEEYVEAVQKSAKHLLVIIDDILDFSKMELDKIELKKSPINLHELVNNAIQILIFKAEEKGLVIEKTIAENVPNYIIGDSVRINQIITNLLGNAIKFTPFGIVRLDVSLKQDHGHNIELLFQVSDTGIGIPQEMRTKIFESFVQANTGIAARFGGTGLGLAIVKKLVEMYGGKISVKSKEGVGATFSFTLHLEKANAGNLPIIEEEKIEEKPLHIKVLIAEDNLVNQLLIKEILKHWHCKIELAENGNIALSKIKESDYDLILMDIQMPEMNGIEASKKIRLLENHKKSAVPIIALTAHTTEKEKENCFEAGMNDYLTKPFDSLDLYRKIISLLNVS